MCGIPCTATVLDFSYDGNFATIKQENVEEITDLAGKTRFNFSTGFLQDLLQGYEYTTVVNCLGGDANVTFTIQQTSSENLRNPLYFTIIFVSDNIVPIMLTLIFLTVVVSLLYFIIKDQK